MLAGLFLLKSKYSNYDYEASNKIVFTQLVEKNKQQAKYDNLLYP